MPSVHIHVQLLIMSLYIYSSNNMIQLIITFSAQSSRHFESRSSLHVSDLAALTIVRHLSQGRILENWKEGVVLTARSAGGNFAN